MKTIVRPTFLDELEPALVAFGATIISGKDATAHGVPAHPERRKFYLLFSHGERFYAVRATLDKERLPFCSMSVRKFTDTEWPVTHYLTKTVDTILGKVRNIENPPAHQTKKPRTLKKGRR